MTMKRKQSFSCAFWRESSRSTKIHSRLTRVDFLDVVVSRSKIFLWKAINHTNFDENKHQQTRSKEGHPASS
eukprot:scaffold1901_cov126-Cylindrotheca_fusiformis.AAC.2